MELAIKNLELLDARGDESDTLPTEITIRNVHGFGGTYLCLMRVAAEVAVWRAALAEAMTKLSQDEKDVIWKKMCNDFKHQHDIADTEMQWAWRSEEEK